MKKLTMLFLIFTMVLLAACGINNTETLDVAFYRKVARETYSDGWVYTFVNNGYKDETEDDSDLIKYQFYGMNLRYKYDDEHIIKTIRYPESEKGGAPYTEIEIPAFLMLGEGSTAEKRDMKLIEEILDSDHSIDYLLSLNPDDYEFEVVDKEMFFRLMRTALNSEPQKEGTDITYWEKPVYAFLCEQTYIDGYKFQIAFLQETGCVDELYIDVLYQTGDGYRDYLQLSDIVENSTATVEQKQAFDMILNITKDIKENESFIINADEYKNKTLGEIDFSRLYDFLNNIHQNNISIYAEEPIIEIVEGIEK